MAKTKQEPASAAQRREREKQQRRPRLTTIKIIGLKC